MLQRRLRGHEYAADVDVNQAIQLVQRGFRKRLRYRHAGIVHQHVQPAQGRNRFFHCVTDCFSVGGVRLDGNRLSPAGFDRFDHGAAEPASFA